MKRILACLIGLFFAMPSWAALPSGYTELEYIESTGTQYIDTGISDFTHLKFENVLQIMGPISNGMYVEGMWKGDTYGDYFLYISTTVQTGFGSYWSNSTKSVDTLKHTWIFENNGTNAMALCDGEQVWTRTRILMPFSNIIIFGDNMSSEISVKHYSKKFWRNNVLIANFVPAKRNFDEIIGAYDTVSNTFFTNQGTGEFIAGPEVIIKIATTKFVDEEFAPVEAKLATTVQTIESVVSRTITQTGQIATLQAEKQTRPDETCPAGKKCLLVQDEDGTPHWYEIIEP